MCSQVSVFRKASQHVTFVPNPTRRQSPSAHADELLFLGFPQKGEQNLTHAVRLSSLSNEAIKSAAASRKEVPGTEVRRGVHLRVSY
jgi:hypothetical protein